MIKNYLIIKQSCLKQSCLKQTCFIIVFIISLQKQIKYKNAQTKRYNTVYFWLRCCWAR